MGGVAAVASIASVAMSAGGSIMKGMGTNAGDQYQAARLERAAEYGRVSADQTDAQMRENLNVSLGNIDAVRAAAHTDPSSPTGAAIVDRTEMLGDRARGIKVGNILAQTNQEQADASYLQSAGSFAQTMGFFGAGADVMKGIGSTNFGAFGGGAPQSFGGTYGFAPDDI
jgi:hypothetical protein